MLNIKNLRNIKTFGNIFKNIILYKANKKRKIGIDKEID